MNETDRRSARSDSLARLEARVRWLTAMTTFLSLGFVGLLVWEFFPRQPIVEARRFVLRDDAWRRRGELGFRDDGSPTLRLLNPEGRTRVALYLPGDGAGTLRISDTHGTERARLGLRSDGTPTLALLREDGKPGVTSSADEEGVPAVKLEADGKVLWEASAADVATHSRSR